MMKDKTKIKLTPEQETLLIPLYAKAQPDNPLFYDPKARQILESVDYDFSKLKVPNKTVVLVSQRANKLDETVQTFLAENPVGVVLHLGCGLDNRFGRLDNGQVEWYDLDMPEVIELRRRFFAGKDRYHLIASSVTDLTWVEQVQAVGLPVLVVAGGLLMYLGEADVKRLFQRLQTAFPGCRLVADVFSRLAARSATNHPSLKKTGASLGWGVDDPHAVEAWGSGIRLIEEWYFSQDPGLQKLGKGYQMVYKIAGAFEAARRAHRIVYFQL